MKKTMLALFFLANFSLIFSHSTTEKKPTIIFAFTNVLYQIDQNLIKNYIKSTLNWKNKISLGLKLATNRNFQEKQKDYYFRALNLVKRNFDKSDNKKYPAYGDQKKIPPILATFLRSNNPSKARTIYNKVTNTIQNLNRINNEKIKSSHKKIFLGSARYTFLASAVNESLKPINDMIQLAQRLKKEGYEVLLVSNSAGSIWNNFLQSSKSSQITSLFPPDNCFISGLLGTLCPSPEFFAHILGEYDAAKDSYELRDPKNCIFIEAEVGHFTYPQSIGMHCIAYEGNTQKVEQSIKKLS